jgi:hypothetical protein
VAHLRYARAYCRLELIRWCNSLLLLPSSILLFLALLSHIGLNTFVVIPLVLLTIHFMILFNFMIV